MGTIAPLMNRAPDHIESSVKLFQPGDARPCICADRRPDGARHLRCGAVRPCLGSGDPQLAQAANCQDLRSSGGTSAPTPGAATTPTKPTKNAKANKATEPTKSAKAKRRLKHALPTDATRALAGYDAMQKSFYVPGTGLYKGEPETYSYLWPFSQALAATVSVGRIPGESAKFKREMHVRLVGLQRYWGLAVQGSSGSASGPTTSSGEASVGSGEGGVGAGEASLRRRRRRSG